MMFLIWQVTKCFQGVTVQSFELLPTNLNYIWFDIFLLIITQGGTVASTVALQSKGPGQDKGLPVPAWILSKYSGFLQ